MNAPWHCGVAKYAISLMNVLTTRQMTARIWYRYIGVHDAKNAFGAPLQPILRLRNFQTLR